MWFGSEYKHRTSVKNEQIGNKMAIADIDKCRTFKAKLGPFHIKLNPVVTIASIILIWSLIIVALIWPDATNAEISTWTKWVTRTWTWLYVGTQDVWAVFVVMLYFSKYSNMKLGKPNEKPEFSDASYFTMLFAAGIGIGLFYFGVAEPIWHYEPGAWGNRYWARYTDNQRAQDAINVTLFHWGIHGWIVYVVVGLLLGFIAYRHDRPMTMRTCFYPLIGDRVYGTLGDIIDTLSVVCTMFGVCTSLGYGAIQVNGGLKRLNTDISDSAITQIIIIWVITAMATISVVSGLKVGIRRLSEICFGLGCFLLFIVFFYDETWYFLNVFTQSTGYYLQWIVQLGFHTDAFAQMANAPDHKEAPDWMNSWTIFYWGWWISWSPFVGMFIAKISKGRTIKQFITYTLTVPIVYTFFWFSVFGGAGILMERRAIQNNITCNSVLGGKNSSGPGVYNLWRLSCRGKNDMWFDVIEQYEGIGGFLAIVSLAAIILYFVTSSDSGSLVIDCLGANGEQEPPVLQRVFWALTEGACATALLYAGGNEALSALQGVSVCAGLFYTIILNFMCVALWRSVKEDGGDLDPFGPQFSSDFLDPFYHVPNVTELKQYVIAIFAPWWPLSGVASKLYNNPKRWPYMLVLGIPFYICFILWFLSIWFTGLQYIGFSILMGFMAYSTGIRSNLRDRDSINGNMFEDFFAFLFGYPLATIQLENHINDFDPDKKRDYPPPAYNGNNRTGEVHTIHIGDPKHRPDSLKHSNSEDGYGRSNPAYNNKDEKVDMRL